MRRLYQQLRKRAGRLHPAVILAGTGLFVWTGLSIWAGMGAEPAFRLREAWDSPAYLYFGLPLMAVAAAIAGFRDPSRPWRGPFWLAAGHQAGVLLVGLGMQSGLSLAILTLILAMLLAGFLMLPAFLGSVLARQTVPEVLRVR